MHTRRRKWQYADSIIVFQLIDELTFVAFEAADLNLRHSLQGKITEAQRKPAVAL